MEYTMQPMQPTLMKRSAILGAPVSEIAESADSRCWLRQPSVLRRNDFPTVHGTGVSAGGCRT